MSFGSKRLLSGVQEVFSIVLTLITVLVLFYGEMDFTYKIAIALFSFTLIFLMNIAYAYLKLQKEQRERQIRQS